MSTPMAIFFFPCASVPLWTHLDAGTQGIIIQDDVLTTEIGKLDLYVEEKEG
jgi:hypothetical protein